MTAVPVLVRTGAARGRDARPTGGPRLECRIASIARSGPLVPVVVSPRALLITLAGVLAGVALLAAATRTVAIATGRDFLFGLIPAFDPAGTRNLIAWVSSMLLGGSAVLMELASQCCVARRGRPCGSRAVAGALAVCSLSGLTAVAGFLPASLGSVAPQRAVLAGSAVVAAAVTLLIRRPSHAQTGLVWTGLLLVFLSQFGPGSAATPVDAARALGSRIAEWGGAVLLLVAATRLAFERQPLIIRIEAGGGGWPLRARQAAGVCDVTLDPGALTRAAAWAIVLLASLSLMFAWPAARSEAVERWYRFFFADFEGNAPSWFSALLLLWCGLVAGVIAAATRALRHADWGLWVVVGVGLAALSADEAASFHELLVRPLRALVGGSPWLRYPLILPGTVAVLCAAAVLWGFVRRLPGGTRRAILNGGSVFLAGALGLETVGGWYDPELHGASTTYVWLATVEEVCEMAGVTIVLRGLLGHLEHHVGALEVRPGLGEVKA